MKINKPTIFISMTILPLMVWCQIGPIHNIDISVESAGVTKFQSADLDNDGDMELIASFTGTDGKIGFYDNLSNGSFSSVQTIEDLSFSRGIATGNFNNDGWTDMVAIGGINAETKVYLNILGTFSEGIVIDSNIAGILNGVVVQDFDANGFDDFVVIGQHSIDFYRNDGIGNFSKEIILSTVTAVPRVLECLDIATADIDNDGDMDVITAETEGLVVYINNGNAIFTPHYHSIIPEIGLLIHPMDMDNDNDLDVVLKTSTEGVKWFSNDGNGTMTFQNTLTNLPNIKSIASIDYDNDGLKDIYVSYPSHIAIFLNDNNHEFSTQIAIHQNNTFPMGPVYLAEMDNQDYLDFVWSGGTNTIAYHANQTPLSVTEVQQNGQFLFFPNPTSGIIQNNDIHSNFDTIIYNMLGQQILKTNKNIIDMSSYPNGLYQLHSKNKDTNSTFTQKIIKK